MNLEQKHKGIFFPTNFHPSPPPPVENLRDLKLCEICTKIFFRRLQLEIGADGVERYVGKSICDNCSLENYDNHFSSARDIRSLMEIANSLKESIKKFRKAGAPLVKIIEIQRHQPRKKWASWREPLLQALKEKGKLDVNSIANIYGAHRREIIYEIRRAGVPLVCVGRMPKLPGQRRGYGIYSLSRSN